MVQSGLHAPMAGVHHGFRLLSRALTVVLRLQIRLGGHIVLAVRGIQSFACLKPTCCDYCDAL